MKKTEKSVKTLIFSPSPSALSRQGRGMSIK
jgi:hypothetical protein